MLRLGGKNAEREVLPYHYIQWHAFAQCAKDNTFNFFPRRVKHVGRHFGRSEYSRCRASVFLKVLGIVSLGGDALRKNEGHTLCNNKSDGCGQFLWKRGY